jgi:AcrR family transcriptional regulator
MQQEEKSERSRRQILDAALDLYSHQGYRGTSVRDIAERAQLSTGNVYHHFPDKESIFRTLLDEYWEILAQPDYPLNRALASGIFPDNLEAIGFAARDSVKKYKKHVALIYVDVVEFDGSHIRRFYSDMATRFQSFIDSNVEKDLLEKKLRPGVSPVSSVMLAFRFFLNYFTVEVLFGVKNHFGKETDEVVRETADILRNGIAAQESVEDLPRPRPRAAKPFPKE